MAKVLDEKTTPAFDVEGYVFDDSPEVLAFLQEHPTLIPVLAEAIDPVRQVFGKDTLVSLFLVEDHDSDDDIRVFARIQTTLIITAAQGLRSEFYSRWWNDNIHRVNDLLVFGLEFVDG